MGRRMKNKNKGGLRKKRTVVVAETKDAGCYQEDGTPPPPIKEDEIFKTDLNYSHNRNPPADEGWRNTLTKNMINEFTDINEQEKEVMTLWNYHMNLPQNSYVGDQMMPRVCKEFVELNWTTLVEKKLECNFKLFLACLYDYGLLSTNDIRQIILQLDALKNNTGPVKEDDGHQEQNEDDKCKQGQAQQEKEAQKKVDDSCFKMPFPVTKDE